MHTTQSLVAVAQRTQDHEALAYGNAQLIYSSERSLNQTPENPASSSPCSFKEQAQDLNTIQTAHQIMRNSPQLKLEQRFFTWRSSESSVSTASECQLYLTHTDTVTAAVL